MGFSTEKANVIDKLKEKQNKRKVNAEYGIFEFHLSFCHARGRKCIFSSCSINMKFQPVLPNVGNVSILADLSIPAAPSGLQKSKIDKMNTANKIRRDESIKCSFPFAEVT